MMKEFTNSDSPVSSLIASRLKEMMKSSDDTLFKKEKKNGGTSAHAEDPVQNRLVERDPSEKSLPRD